MTPAQVAEAMLLRSSSDKRLGTMLLELGVINERQLIEALATQLGLPLANLRQHTPEPAAAALLSDSLARSLHAIPMRIREDGVVEVAVGDRTERTVEELEHALGRRVALLLAPPSEIGRAIDATYRALSGVEEQVAAFAAGSGGRQPAESTGRAAAAEIAGADAPVVRVVNKLITQALRDRASDIHIEPQDGLVRVRFRIDGALHDVVELPGAMATALASRIKIMASMNIVERRRPQDGQIAMTVDGRGIDIRVAADRLWSWTYSTGSSTTSTCTARLVLIQSTRDASVVDLPDPVGPVTRTRPCLSRANRRTDSGRPSASKDGISRGMSRSAIAVVPRCRKALPRTRALHCQESEKSMSEPCSKATCCGFESNAAEMRSVSVGVSGPVPGTGRNSPSTRISGVVPTVRSRSVPPASQRAPSRSSTEYAGGSAIPRQ